jgi:inhibitor of KinA
MEITPLGDSALIVRVVSDFARDPNRSLELVSAALRSLEAAAIPGVIDLAPAYATIGVFYDPTRIELVAPNLAPFDLLKEKIENVLIGSKFKRQPKGKSPVTEIPVCYEGEFGPDLSDVARVTGLDESEIVRRHLSASYRVACIGFVPGFAFLSGLSPELAAPRRASPRKSVPAGSVGIGGEQTGIYPGRSPGGWNLIGRTPCRMFDLKREPASLLQPGDWVQFRKISCAKFESLVR